MHSYTLFWKCVTQKQWERFQICGSDITLKVWVAFCLAPCMFPWGNLGAA